MNHKVVGMTRYRALIVTFCMSLLPQMNFAQEPIRTPTANELVSQVPILSPHNDNIRNARFTLHSWREDATKDPMRFDVQWSHNQPPGMLISHPTWKSPLQFISQNQCMFCLISDRRLWVFEDQQPKMIIRRTEGEIKQGIGNKKTDSLLSIEVDLPSLISQSASRSIVKQNADGNWFLQTISSTTSSTIKMTFAHQSPYRLQKFELRSRLTGEKQLLIDNILFNDDSMPPWPAFPSLDDMPTGFRICTGDDKLDKDKPLDEKMVILTSFLVSAMIQFGSPEEYGKENELGKDVDWEAVEKSHKEVGPILRQALGFGPIVDDGFPATRR